MADTTSTYQSPEDYARELEGKIKSLQESRRKFEQKCYINDAFMDGEHFLGFNRATGRLEKERSPQGRPVRTIHKGYRKMVDMKNTIVADDPMFVVHPGASEDGEYSQDRLDETMRQNDFLREVINRQDLVLKRDEAVFSATKHPYAVLWSNMNPEGKSLEDIWDLDMLEFYDVGFDASVTDVQDSGLVYKAWMMEEAEAKAKYNLTGELKVDKRWAVSDWKNDRMEDQYFKVPDYKKPVICYEVWQKLVVDKDCRARVKKALPNEKWIDEKQNGDKVMYVCTLVGGKIAKEQYSAQTLYPCTAFHVPDGRLLQPAPVERVISANKSLDVQQTRQEEYVNEVAVGRVSKHKTVKIMRNTNSHGDYHEWDGPPDLKPTWEAIPALPPTVMQVMANTERFIDEATVYGGQVGQVVHGGRGSQSLEALKGVDVSSVSSGRKNLAFCLKQLCEIINEQADLFLNRVVSVNPTREDGKHASFKVVGSRYAQTDLFHQGYNPSVYQGLKPTVISSSTKVTVSIEPGMAFTHQARQDLIKELASLKLIPAEKAMRLLKISSNVSEDLRQMDAEDGKSVIDTQDFPMLSPDTQQLVLNELQQLNMSMTRYAEPRGSTRKTAPNGLAG